MEYLGHKNMECRFTSVAVAIDNHSHLNEFNTPVCATLFIVMYWILPFLYGQRFTWNLVDIYY